MTHFNSQEGQLVFAVYVCVNECGWCWGHVASVASVGVDVECGVIGAQLPLIISTK